MVGEVEPAVFVVVVDLLLLVVLDLGVGVFISFGGYVLQGQTLFQPLAHLNYFIIISIPIHKRKVKHSAGRAVIVWVLKFRADHLGACPLWFCCFCLSSYRLTFSKAFLMGRLFCNIFSMFFYAIRRFITS